MKTREEYYTPKLEEFHTGFEYEVMIPEKSLWSKEIFYLNESHINYIKYISLQNEFIKNKIRVKYLDKEDIESLNFIRNTQCCYGYDDFFSHNKTKLRLLIDYERHFIILKFPHDDFGTSFQGDIKNKSELEVLLKQLNIK